MKIFFFYVLLPYSSTNWFFFRLLKFLFIKHYKEICITMALYFISLHFLLTNFREYLNILFIFFKQKEGNVQKNFFTEEVLCCLLLGNLVIFISFVTALLLISDVDFPKLSDIEIFFKWHALSSIFSTARTFKIWYKMSALH